MSETPSEIAARLNPSQRKLLLAASKRPKRWMTIRRHAKLAPTVRVHGLTMPLRLLDHGSEWWRGYSLTPLGIQVRAILTKDASHGE